MIEIFVYNINKDRKNIHDERFVNIGGEQPESP